MASELLVYWGVFWAELGPRSPHAERLATGVSSSESSLCYPHNPDRGRLWHLRCDGAGQDVCSGTPHRGCEWVAQHPTPRT